ncbi:MAG TPA: ABC transporter ATP-binding protein [Fimbriimonadaceae bacterium]|nr:ABC transporter ATP-binding protein [Fimbriimonadaceae bacterium]
MAEFRLFRKFDPRLSRELKAQRKTIFKGLACVAVTSLLTSLTIPVVKWIVSAIEQKNLTMIGWLALGVVGLFGVKYWFTRGQAWYLSKAANLMIADLRVRLFDKLQRLPVSYFNSKRSGAIQSVLSNDVGVYQSAVMIVRDSIDGPIKAIGAIAAVIFMSWQLAIVALLFVPVLAFVIQRNGKKMKAAQAKVQDDYAELLAMTNEALHGTRVVRAFGAEDRMRDIYRDHVNRTFASSMKAVGRLASLRPLVELIGAVALALVIYLCGYLSVRTGFSVGDMAALIYALDVINQGFRTLGYANNTYQQVIAATDRIYSEILDVPEDSTSGGDLPGTIQGRIEFQNVSFEYPDGTEALKDVSFVIEPGTSLALVGPSGAGKSTVADLLLRFYDPTSGRILLDGQDIREINPTALRHKIGVVPQQTFLFAGTIADNIRLGAPEATDDQIRAAAVAAHADNFINQSAEGYETEIGEQGVGLSGGERQRVAIARALVRLPSILLLDEATSALDAESEKAVQAALDEIMRGRTTLYIAHRLTTAARADNILMLSKGAVLEYGSHRSLLEANGNYAAMYRAFNSGLIDEGGVL